MRAACLGMPPRAKLMRGARITRLPPTQCTHTTRWTVQQVIQPAHRVNVHNSCGCNEMHALQGRHLYNYEDDPKLGPLQFDEAYFKSKTRQFRKSLNIRPHQVSYDTIINHYTGPKRKRYIAAAAEIKLRGLTDEFIQYIGLVSMFVKPDKYSEFDVWSKKPRAIQFRNPCYTLALSSLLHTIEQQYYQTVDWTGQRVVAKGLTNIERATNIVEASKLFDKPVYLLLDHSKFDAHVRVEHLRWLHGFYKWCYRGQPSRVKLLDKLLKQQINNKCFTKNGIRYTVRGTRMSGDTDTSLGNTLLNHYMMTIVLTMKHHLLVDGDDSVVVIEERDLPKFNLDKFRSLGMHTECQIVRELYDVEFCRSKLLPLDPPRFAREPRRALSNLNVCLKNYQGKAVLRHVAGLGLCEAAASQGVPILGPIAHKMAACSDRKLYDDDAWYRHYVDGPIKEMEITDEARLAFMLAYGITPAQQVMVEQAYQTPRGLCTNTNYLVYMSLPLAAQDLIF